MHICNVTIIVAIVEKLEVISKPDIPPKLISSTPLLSNDKKFSPTSAEN